MTHTSDQYQLRASGELDEKAHSTLTATALPDENRVVAFRFDGTCPGCNGPMQITHPILGLMGEAERVDTDVLIDAADALGKPRGDMDIPLHCTCGSTHKDHPDDELGCGARFSIHVKWGQP